MILGDFLVGILVCEYAIIAGVYGFSGDYNRLIYWIGAVILNIGVLRMR